MAKFPGPADMQFLTIASSRDNPPPRPPPRPRNRRGRTSSSTSGRQQTFSIYAAGKLPSLKVSRLKILSPFFVSKQKLRVNDSSRGFYRVLTRVLSASCECHIRQAKRHSREREKRRKTGRKERIDPGGGERGRGGRGRKKISYHLNKRKERKLISH